MSNGYISKDMKSGHKEIIGETIAKLKLFYEGFNVYSRFLDTDAVDFIIRRRNKNNVYYKEIQMKYSKNYDSNVGAKGYWYGIRKRSFEKRDNHFFMFICGDIEHIFIIPSKKLVNYLKSFHEDKDKWHVRIRERKNMWYFITKKGREYINITEFLNDFKSLK